MSFPSLTSSSLPTGGVALSLLAVIGSLLYYYSGKKKNRSLDEAPAVPQRINHDTTGTNGSSKNNTKQPSVVFVCGAGTIGASFTAVYLSQGKHVHVYYPHVDRDTLEKRIQGVWLALTSRGITDMKEPPLGAALSNSSTGSLQEALESIQKNGQSIEFVQEATWEDVDHKQKVLAELDKLLDRHIIIASSTSFIPWTLLVTHCTHKHRIMIGHPAIPHTMAFMEIYGTHPEWVQHCKEWYTSVSFDVVVMTGSIPGHVFNSFLSLNMQHGHKLVRDGVCSPADVNKTMRYLARGIYGSHTFLSLPIVIGGDRGMKGGMELFYRIKRDAVFLILFSAMKEKAPLVPDFVARPVSKVLGRIIVKLFLPEPAEESIRATTLLEKELTENGTLPPQVAMGQRSVKFYEKLPMELGRDEFALPKSFEEACNNI